jgi:PilZ domain
VRVLGFESSLGSIADISASGVRILTRSAATVPVGRTIAVVLETPRGTVEVEARVVWWKQAGWFRHEVGLEFESLTAEARGAIADLAKSGDERV